jgi:MHS family alpha-ketoglutarate permease-like MFS transporter
MSDRIGTYGAVPSDNGSIAPRRGKTIVGGAIGHFIEWYDWSIYGFLAGLFAGQMFPSGDPTVSLILAYSAFAVGFIGRPIGALVLSPLADKYGRRTLLAATILLTGVGSFVIALCPTYAQIGIAAPLLITAMRLLQGFAAGGEFQIAIAFLNEHATTRNRALAASPQLVSIGLAVLAATGVAALTTKFVPQDALATWGWRVPFLLGAVIALYGIYLRRGLDETPSFEKLTERQRVTIGSIFAALARHPKEAFIVFVVQMSGVQYYLWMIFLPTYAKLAGGLDQTAGFTGSMIATAAYCVGVPVVAFISDRIGRKPFFIASAACFLVFVYPLLSLLVGTVSLRRALPDRGAHVGHRHSLWPLRRDLRWHRAASRDLAQPGRRRRVHRGLCHGDLRHHAGDAYLPHARDAGPLARSGRRAQPQLTPSRN